MPSRIPAFSFEEPIEPQVLAVARSIAARIASGERTDRKSLNAMMGTAFGGSDADGRWSVRDAHAAIEFGQVLWLLDTPTLKLFSDPVLAESMFVAAASLLPAQTVRSEEQIELQQFGTPPWLAWVAARAGGIAPSDYVLEPSAGTGMLAIWAKKAGARLALNEISPLRRDCLGRLFPDAKLSGQDGELIDDLLDPAIIPSLVLMNPPFSHGLERGHDGKTGTRHLRSAWKRLAPGGRLVAIMPEWFDVGALVAGENGSVALRANIAIDDAFLSRGTSIATRLIVADKSPTRADPVTGRGAKFAELWKMVAQIPVRDCAQPGRSVPTKKPARLSLVRMATSSARPVPPARSATQGVAVPCAYEVLAEPAAIADQVGHYLP